MEQYITSLRQELLDFYGINHCKIADYMYTIPGPSYFNLNPTERFLALIMLIVTIDYD